MLLLFYTILDLILLPALTTTPIYVTDAVARDEKPGLRAFCNFL